MRILLIALAVAVPINCLRAEQLRLRCDSLASPSEIQMLTIDTDHQSVRWNDNVYINNRRYATQGRDQPETRNTYGKVGCRFDTTQFVHVSNSKIEFGESTLLLNRCGQVGNPNNSMLSGSPYENNPSGRPDITSYSIDRTTGLADLAGRYQCQRITGNAF